MELTYRAALVQAPRSGLRPTRPLRLGSTSTTAALRVDLEEANPDARVRLERLEPIPRGSGRDQREARPRQVEESSHSHSTKLQERPPELPGDLWSPFASRGELSDGDNVPAPTAEQPFSRLEYRLRQHRLDPSTARLTSPDTLLATVHPAAFAPGYEWDWSTLRSILTLRQNGASLAQLLPALTSTLQAPLKDQPIDGALYLVGLYVRHVTYTANHVFLGPAVDLAMDLLDRGVALNHQHLPAEEVARLLLARTLRLLRVLAGYDKSGARTAASLPPAVLHQMGRVVPHMLKSLEQLNPESTVVNDSASTQSPSPSSSAALSPRISLALSPRVKDALLSSRYLVPHSVTAVIQHCIKYRVTVTEEQWRTAANVALNAHDKHRALEYIALAFGFDSNLNPAQRIVIARAAKSFRETFLVLEPLLQQRPAGAGAHRVAASGGSVSAQDDTEGVGSSLEPAFRDPSRLWSILAHAAAKDPTVPGAALVEIANAIPDDAVSVWSFTPIISGLVYRRDEASAIKLWEELRRLHDAAEPRERARYLNSAALAVGAQAQYAKLAPRGDEASSDWRASVGEAFKLIDRYGQRVKLPMPADKLKPWKIQKRGRKKRTQVDGVQDVGEQKVSPRGRGTSQWLAHLLQRHQTPKLNNAAEPSTSLKWNIPLDVGALNVLLRLCLRAQVPALAFRLWACAVPRWGVTPDTWSLAYLLDLAQYPGDPDADPFQARLQALADVLRPGRATVLPERNWAVTHPNTVLGLRSFRRDDGEYARVSWRDEHGVSQPWDVARDLFRTIVLGNWPQLAAVGSPLTRARGGLGAIADLFNPPTLAASPPTSTHPRPAPRDGPFAHLIPNPSAWNAYIHLAARRFGADDAVQALAWMRALGVRPQRTSMQRALLAVGEEEGPRRRVRIDGEVQLVRDEEVLRAWLLQWAENVPSEDDVAAFRRRGAQRAAARGEWA